MTGPIIPADQWPEGATAHVWDKGGEGNWLKRGSSIWYTWPSLIPLPAGHDWCVPVMRPVAPAIDLEQFRKSVDAAWACGAIDLAEAKRLMALIDGQAKPFVCTGDVLRCFDGNGCECRMRGLECTKGEGE